MRKSGSGRLLSILLVVALIGCVGVAAYALIVYAVLPLGTTVSPEMQTAFKQEKAAIYTHASASALALALLPIQICRNIRERSWKLHRWIGRLYGLLACAGSVSGFICAFKSQGGMAAHVGFMFLAISWFSTTVAGIAAQWIFHNQALHRRLMYHSFGLAYAAITLRIYLGISLGANNGMFSQAAYAAIAWICWLPHPFIVELVLWKSESPGSWTAADPSKGVTTTYDPNIDQNSLLTETETLITS